MKITIIVILLPIILLGFSMDMESGAMESTFDEFPFYLQYSNVSSMFCFDDAEYTGNIFFNDMLSTRAIFFDDYGSIISIPYIKRNFSVEDKAYDLYYGGGFVNSRVNNTVYQSRIYGSLMYNDDEYTVRTHSFVQLQESSPINYRNTVNAVYRNILIKTELDSDNYSILTGYYNTNGYAAAGYSKGNTIPVTFAANYKGINVMGEFFYDLDSNRISGDIVSMYTLRFGRLTVLPIMQFNDSLYAALGLAYRVTPEITNFINYMYSSNIINGGIRADNDYVMSNFNIAYNINAREFAYDISLLAENAFALISSNMHYDSLLTWSAGFNLRKTFFNDNLIPGIYASYKENNELFCALIVKLIDAEIYGGALFYLNEQKYMIKGGMKWYFSENNSL